MARRLLLRQESGPAVLHESSATDEAQLQALIRDHPELLSVEEFGLPEPLLIVGKETNVPSGAVDLVGIARNGELVIAEFKTGPQNTDFRRATAQLLDYGSHLWGLTFDEFEMSVPKRYFTSTHCSDPRVKELASLKEAAQRTWDGFTDGEFDELSDHLAQRLKGGQFHYVLLAQRFTESIQRTLDYMNATSQARFYAVEIVRFENDVTEAFETRTVLQPPPASSHPSVASVVNEAQLLETFADDDYAAAVRELLQLARASGFRFSWGTVGVSIRVPVPDHSEPVSVAWLFPPGRSGWSGFRDLTLGFDRTQAARSPGSMAALQQYLTAVCAIPLGEPAKSATADGAHFSPAATVESLPAIRDALIKVAELVNGESSPAPISE